MTSRADRFEHAVMATELEQANRTGQHPMGLCGVVVDPAPLGATAQHVCRPCRELIGRRRQELRAPQPTPWTLLVQWYEALIQLLRSRGVAAQRAIAAPSPVLALPVAADRPSPRPRVAPHPVREAGGRHRRGD